MAGISGQWLSVIWALSESVIRARVEWQVYLDSGCQLLWPCQRHLEPWCVAGISGQWLSVIWALSESVIRARVEWQVYLDSGCQLLWPCQRHLEPWCVAGISGQWLSVTWALSEAFGAMVSGRYIWTVAVSYLGPVRGIWSHGECQVYLDSGCQLPVRTEQ